MISFAKVFRNHVITFARCLPLSLRFRCYLKPAAAAGIARAPAYDFKTHATGSSARRKQHEAPMHLTFPWQRRASQDTGEAIPPRRSLSPVRFAFARPPKTRSPSPQRRSPTKEPVQMAPSESAEFAAAAGSASSVDERTLRTLLMRQPAAQELGLTDDALMDSFVRSCAVSSKPSPDSPSSVVSPGPRARYTCAQYLRVVADLSQYGHDVRLGTLLVGNGRSVLQSNAGGLVDNHGAVVRFNDYQTEGRPPRPHRQPSTPSLHTLSSPPHPIQPSTPYPALHILSNPPTCDQPVHLLPVRLPTCPHTLLGQRARPPPPPAPLTPPTV